MVPPPSVPPGAEVKGTVPRLVVDGMSTLPDEAEARGDEVLADAGVTDPDPDAWYSLREWLAVLDELGATVGDDGLRQLGTNIPAGAEWPTEVNSSDRGFDTVNEAYQMNHRGGDVGYYEFVGTGDRKRTVVCENPYPCPFDKGIIEGVLQTFGEEFNYSPMVFIQETGDHCRADGGERCEYRVMW